MDEVVMRAPQVRWADLGGVDEARERLRDGIELPFRYPDAFRRMGIRPANGFLLYGPPGSGKSLLAEAAAYEAGAGLIPVSAGELLSKWHAACDRRIAEIFAQARQAAPCLIFFDELDSLAPARGSGMGEPHVGDRVINGLLTEMDRLDSEHAVVVIGSASRPKQIDPALLRPGRFDELIYVAVPDAEGRRRILELQTAHMPLGADVDLDRIARRTERFTGSDLEDLVRRAGLFALKESFQVANVEGSHFELALLDGHPSVTPEIESEYEQIAARLKQDANALEPVGFHTPAAMIGDRPKQR